MLKNILKEKHISIYKCSKLSNLPYTTIYRLANNKSKLENCSVKTINRLSHFLEIDISDLLNNKAKYRMPFEEFKSEICHNLKALGDVNFIKYVYKNKLVLYYYNISWYEETFYTLALLDYVSHINNIPVASEYDFLRLKKLKNRIYPRDLNIISKLSKKHIKKNDIIKMAIPEFLKYNIVETNIRNVC
ncbi:MAG: helix-turn-helix transcriptional regulator [Lachnospiraceae bacterium]|nr:helix-turn-helix transcriptional regulator [Lachnospiraceae bacterium]